MSTSDKIALVGLIVTTLGLLSTLAKDEHALNKVTLRENLKENPAITTGNNSPAVSGSNNSIIYFEAKK